MHASIIKHPGITFPAAAGPLVSESLLIGRAVGAIAHYKLGADAGGLVNHANPGVYDLVPTGVTPPRSVGCATVSKLGAYDTGIPVPFPFAAAVYFESMVDQYVMGTGFGASDFYVASEAFSAGTRMRVSIGGGAAQPGRFARQDPRWCWLAFSCNATTRETFLAQAAALSPSSTASGSFSLTPTNTLRIGGHIAYSGASYNNPVRVAEVIIWPLFKVGANLGETYPDTRLRMLARGVPLSAV